MITNKERHKTVTYSSDECKLSNHISHNSFVSLEEISDRFYEVLTNKTKIILDIPVVLGFAVLQYAKLKMLSFYYDCIDL